MTLTPVESLPKRAVYGRNDIEKLIKEFVNSGVKIARIDYRAYEYKSSNALYSGVYNAIARLEVPVKVRMRNLQVYLIRL